MLACVHGCILMAKQWVVNGWGRVSERIKWHGRRVSRDLWMGELMDIRKMKVWVMRTNAVVEF